MTEVKIRPIKKNESALLEEFLYDAIYIPPGEPRPGKEIILLPELSLYYRDFGRKGDLCLIAELEGKAIAAIWSRLFSEREMGFGYVNAETPELSMSVKAVYQNCGIGTLLLTRMITTLKEKHYPQVSLSVDIQNFAYKLYRKFGFESLRSDGKSATIIKILRD